MASRIINTAADMDWLREVHLTDLGQRFQSAVITGNDDSPERIDVYESVDPQITDTPVSYFLVDGDYHVLPTKLVGISDFVKRQTALSTFAHFNGSWEKLAALATKHFTRKNPGFRPGVLLVEVPALGFWTSIVRLNQNSRLESKWAPRTDGEGGFIQTVVKNWDEHSSLPQIKAQANHVVLVLYSAEALSENGGTRSTDCEWEIVSINASPVEGGKEPMTPMAMARNFLELPGGTKTEYTAQQFAEAIVFWNTHGMVG